MLISTKGQVTIPLEIREKLGLHPGTEVGFEIKGDHVRIIKIQASARSRGASLVRRLEGRGKATGVARSTDEIMKLTRGG